MTAITAGASRVASGLLCLLLGQFHLRGAKEAEQLGDDLSQAPAGGGFNQDPPGNRASAKIFIGEGGQEGEVFFNLNPAIGRGQLSIKDPDYGDLVLAQLEEVL
jgi:hypothetical protein